MKWPAPIPCLKIYLGLLSFFTSPPFQDRHGAQQNRVKAFNSIEINFGQIYGREVPITNQCGESMHWQKCYFLWIAGNLAFPLGDTYRIVFEWVAISPNPQFFYERTGTTWIGLELEGWWLAIAKRYKRNFVWGGVFGCSTHHPPGAPLGGNLWR